MHWTKLGRISISEQVEFENNSYASIPVAMHLDNSIYRIFLSNRDNANRSTPFFVDLDIESLSIVNFSNSSIMSLGKLGAFDDSGVIPSCLLKMNNQLFMYYVGWNICKTVPFRNAIGLAKSMDNGKNFSRVYEGPIMDRIATEPYFCASCHVLFENGIYKIWYLNCTEWELINDLPRHRYHIKYAESIDGVNFVRKGRIAIDFKSGYEYAISVPRIIKDQELYKMWYSYRGDFYKIGYAESKDGLNWIRKDEEVGIERSLEGWDSEMVCYPFVFDHNGNRYMLYNGNGYGKSGFGLAVLEI